MKTSSVAAVIGTGIGSALVLTLLIRWSVKKRQSLVPKQNKWIYIGKLKQITIFPVKSCHGLELDSCECDLFGIKWRGFQDRRLLLLYSDTGKMCWAGVCPRMLSIRSEIIGESLIRLSAPGLIPISLNIEELSHSKKAKVIQKQMKGYRLQLIECLSEHHRWFSQAVLSQDTGLRLFLSMDPIVKRSSWRQIKTDIMPFMVIHDRSVSDLNNRLSNGNRVHHQQFRDNFLIETTEPIRPFDEDNWLWLRIGEDSSKSTILRYNSPCLRCILPNIDIFTCKRNADFEPLATLKKFRLRSNTIEPEMGIYFDLFKAGIAATGDCVYIQYRE